MGAETARLLGAICAGIAVVSTIAYYVVKARELRLLREIRDKLPKS